MTTLTEEEKLIIGVIFLLKGAYASSLLDFFDKIVYEGKPWGKRSGFNATLKKLVRDQWLYLSHGSNYGCDEKVNCEFIQEELMKSPSFMALLEKCTNLVLSGKTRKCAFSRINIILSPLVWKRV